MGRREQFNRDGSQGNGSTNASDSQVSSRTKQTSGILGVGGVLKQPQPGRVGHCHFVVHCNDALLLCFVIQLWREAILFFLVFVTSQLCSTNVYYIIRVFLERKVKDV